MGKKREPIKVIIVNPEAIPIARGGFIKRY